jgi:hypothetical protein
MMSVISEEALDGLLQAHAAASGRADRAEAALTKVRELIGVEPGVETVPALQFWLDEFRNLEVQVPALMDQVTTLTAERDAAAAEAADVSRRARLAAFPYATG